MKSTILILGLFLIIAVNGYCKAVNDNTGKVEPVEHTGTAPGKINESKKENAAAPKKKAVKVRNIWKDMPGYDRFGNEVTERARKNFRENADLKRVKK